ncbi:MAG TPA: GTP cyclohydrolase I FolE [Candidatus Fimousia stercorigallinarum]|nr:GTP cyclohydrolase I FolE [Candidatus Fimousia stercorigallinarum]
MAIDKEAIKEHVRGILIALGDDPDREGLKETPDRVARMYEEVFEGMNYTNDEIAEMFGKTFFEEDTQKGKNDIVLVKDIDIFSYCEHHMALMYDMKVSVAYTPTDRVIGLSKIARIAEMAGKRLQLQERIGSDIAQIISKVTGSEDVAVVIEGCHSCMTARGIKKNDAKTITTTFRGRFDTDPVLQNKLLFMLRK